MSRWFPDGVAVLLDADELCIARGRDTGVTVRVASSAPKGQAWLPALEALEKALAETSPHRSVFGRRVDVVVASRFCRYALVPWHADLVTTSDRSALAAHRFVETHGEAARHWTIRLNDAGYGEPGLACAMDEALLQRIATILGAARLRARSVQPCLMRAFNQARHLIGGPLFWFVLEEAQRLTLLLIEGRRPVVLRSLPGAGQELGTLLDREWRLAGYDIEPCPVYRMSAVEESPVASVRTGRWTIDELAPLPFAHASRTVASRVPELA